MDNHPAGHHLKARGTPPRLSESRHRRSPAVISMPTHHNSARPLTHPRTATGSVLGAGYPSNRFGLRVLGNAGLASDLRAATRRAYDNLVQLCLDEDADLLVLAGDIYDGNWQSYETGEYFVRGLQRLREGGVEPGCTGRLSGRV